MGNVNSKDKISLTDTIADESASSWADRVDESDYRDDLLRLMFVCANPELPATQQIALALRTVSGLSVEQIARAFLVSASAMEQRITRAKRQIADAGIGFETPGAPERAARLSAVMSMIYLIFNEGYASTPDTAALRGMLADEAIRLARLLLALFPADPELMGLLALLLLQHSRAPARFDADGQLVLLDDQDRRQLESADDRGRASVARESAAPSPRRSVSGSSCDRGHTRTRIDRGGNFLGGNRSSISGVGRHCSRRPW